MAYFLLFRNGYKYGSLCFTGMQNGESPKMFMNALLRRFPKRVRAHKRVFVYDNACNAYKYALRRFPLRTRRWLFVVDKFHWQNHLSCSSSFNSQQYPFLKNVNTQLSEQRNKSLRNLATVIAYMKFSSYMKVIELSMSYYNLKVKSQL